MRHNIVSCFGEIRSLDSQPRQKRQRKSVKLHTTFARGSSITLVVFVALLYMSLASAGCTVQRGVSERRYHQALALVDRGTVLLRERNFSEAAAAFEAAQDLAPLAAAFDGLGCAKLHQGDLLGAEQLFRQAYSMDGTYDDALANLGLALDLQGKKEAAADVYRTYLTRVPEAAHVRNNLFVLEYEERGARMVSATELRKAAMFSQHGVIVDNLRIVERSSE
jgi:Flp pilus assembly protein TadD